MKIVTKDEFLKLPSGTLYYEFKPYIFSKLGIKGESLGGNDFYYADLTTLNSAEVYKEYTLSRMQKTKESVPLIFYNSQRGQANDSNMYAVWDVEDVENLVVYLKKECLQTN